MENFGWLQLGYLQGGNGTQGPVRTERARIRNMCADKWEAYFAGRWRKVHLLVKYCYIVYQGERIIVLIDGV